MTNYSKQCISIGLILLSTTALAQGNKGGGWHGKAQHQVHQFHYQVHNYNNGPRGNGAIIPLGDLFDSSCQPSKICNMFGQCRIYQICE